MTKIYKLLIESPEFPKGTRAVYKDEYLDKSYFSPGTYFTFLPGDSIDNISCRCAVLRKGVVENRPEVWELVEDKLDLRSPEAERMREEARSKRWEFIPKRGSDYFYYFVEMNMVRETRWSNSTYDILLWNTGNCHRTREECQVHGEKYARYFLTE